jgi:hypothetical protein
VATSPPKIPPLPQGDPIAEKSGLLTLPWNMFFVELLRYIQANTNSIASLALTGGSGGGGVATSGSAPAVDLTYEPSAEGTLNMSARSDHTHGMAIGIERDLGDLGIANDLDFEQPLDVNVTQLVSGWKMEEASGIRANEITASQYLYEAHGVVNGEAGLIGNAFRPVIDALDRDYRSYGEWLRSTAYVHWYPLGPAAVPEVNEGTVGSPVAGTICILFKPETGIVANGPQIGGLVNFNSTPYAGPMYLQGQIVGGLFKVEGRTTRPGGFDYVTPATTCALDAWHVAFAWLNPTDATINCQVDYNLPVSTTMPDNLVWYGNSTYWMTGPRFKGLIDTSLLWRGVLTSWQRATLVDLLLTSTTDPDFAYESKRNRATVTLNPFALEAFGDM